MRPEAPTMPQPGANRAELERTIELADRRVQHHRRVAAVARERLALLDAVAADPTVEQPSAPWGAGGWGSAPVDNTVETDAE